MMPFVALRTGTNRISALLLCSLCTAAGVALLRAADTRPAPPLPGGVLAVWLNDPRLDAEAIRKLPLIKGGQVMVQWGEVEPQKGKYDFSVFDSRMAEYAARRQPVTIQLNGNQKPRYLFQEVPYVKETGREVPAFGQVENREGTLMFWHPTHEKAYMACLTAFRDHLAASPYKSLVIGLRMNFNPFGTEGINIYPQEKATEYAPKDRWIKPPGLDPSIPYQGFSLPESLNYVRRIIRKHIELFDGVVPMFVRCTVNSEVLADFSQYLEKGTFGIFETGASCVPFASKSEAQEEWILRYCKPGRTVGYAESIGDSWGARGGRRDQLLFSPPQVNYWRVLCDLHKGVSYLAFYGKDLNVAVTGAYQSGSRGPGGHGGGISYSDSQSGFNYRKEFYEALVFADKYAGYHARPEQAPGAWIALRASDAVANAQDTRDKLKVFTNDYTFLMDRLPDKTEGVMKIGPDQIRYGAYARRLPAQAALRVKVNERFLQSLKGPTVLSVIYFDDAAGAGFSVSAAGQTWPVTLHGGKSWQTAAFEVAAPAFPPTPEGAHILIQNGAAPVCLHLVGLDRK